MYTYEKTESLEIENKETWHGESVYLDQYAILDPNNDVLAHVSTEAEAEILLSHLNR